MSAYFPTAWTVVLWLTILLSTQVVAAFALMRRGNAGWARPIAWLLAIACAVTANFICAAEPAGFRMLALISVSLIAMKTLVLVESRSAQSLQLPAIRFLIFTLIWPGMRPLLFAAPRKYQTGNGALAIYAISRMIAGGILFVAARWIWQNQPIVATISALVAISLILHFGLCTLATAALRMVGFDVRPLFRKPLRSSSLGEFWSQRWNLAFSEMTSQVVFRPLREKIGATPALYVSFLLSGVLHEIAISLPVQAGYGLPMLYFLLQAVWVHLETVVVLPRVIRKVATAIVLIGPIPILFHSAFLNAVLQPLLEW